MIRAIVVLAVAALILAAFIARWAWRTRRRKKLMSAAFPPEWREIIARNVPLFRLIPEPLRRELEGDISVFLAEKDFEGCGGLDITDEIRVTVAAQACILLLNRKAGYYPGLSTILVYPSAYVAAEGFRADGTFSNEESVRAGESWDAGTVVLAWDHVQGDSLDVHDGHNVVLHEFAHQLDQQSGVADGRPILGQNTSYVTWGRVMSAEYERLQRRVARHKRSALDDYGATNPAEFFAVATETFFEKPRLLRESEPELYEELGQYYRLDPVEWSTFKLVSTDRGAEEDYEVVEGETIALHRGAEDVGQAIADDDEPEERRFSYESRGLSGQAPDAEDREENA